MNASKKSTRGARFQELVIDNLARFACSGIDDAAMARNFIGLRPDECITDAMHARVIEAAEVLARYETKHPQVWEEFDWRDTCDAAVRFLNGGLQVTEAAQVLT